MKLFKKIVSSDPLKRVDLALVVDTTGSMGPFIQAARAQLVDIIDKLVKNIEIELKTGLVEFRDHPPQDRSFVTRVRDLTPDLQLIQRKINGLNASGGGDGPEAVYQGLADAIDQLSWSPHSYRFAILVGDAPPHAFNNWLNRMTGSSLGGNGDGWPNACPSGLEVQSVALKAENKRVRIFGLSLGNWGNTQQAFDALASATGGQHYLSDNADQVVTKIRDLLQKELESLDFDRSVLETVTASGNLDTQFLAGELAVSRQKVALSVSRLGARGFFDNFIQD